MELENTLPLSIVNTSTTTTTSISKEKGSSKKNKCTCTKFSRFNTSCFAACGCRKKGAGCSAKCKCQGKCSNGLPNDNLFFLVWKNVVIFRLIYHYVNPAKTAFIIEYNKRKQIFELEFPSEFIINASNQYIVDHYLKGRLDFQRMISSFRAKRESAEREKLLIDALAVFKLKLRSDSTLCRGFIRGTLISKWSIDAVVHEMCKMKYFFDYCGITSYVRGRSFDSAKEIVEQKYGIPEVWPWMDGNLENQSNEPAPLPAPSEPVPLYTDYSFNGNSDDEDASFRAFKRSRNWY